MATEVQAPGGPSFIQRWLARLALVAIAAGLLVTAAAVWWADR